MEICYVCNNKIKVKGLYIGKGTYRHASRCAPGSDKWLASSIGKKSKNRIYFIRKGR